MNVRQLTQVLIRLWALSLLVRAVVTLPSQVMLLGGADGSDPQVAMMRAAQLGSMIGLMFTIVIGVILFALAPAIAAWIVREDAALNVAVTAREGFIVAVAVMGLYLIVTGAELLASAGYALISKPSWDESGGWEYVWARHRNAIPAAVVRIVGGWLLFAGRRFLAERAVDG